MTIIGGPGDKENLSLPPDDKAETSKPVKAALHQLSQSSKDLEHAGVQLSISAPPPTAEHVARLASKIVLDEFLQLPVGGQEIRLKESSYATSVRNAIKEADQNVIREAEKGRVLIHLLSNSSSPVVRELAEACLEGGCSINIPDKYGTTPLHYVVYHADPSLIAHFLNKGADPSLQRTIAPLGTPAELAVVMRFYDLALMISLHKPDLPICGMDPGLCFMRNAHQLSSPEGVVQLLEGAKAKGIEDPVRYWSVWGQAKLSMPFGDDHHQGVEFLLKWLIVNISSEKAQNELWGALSWIAQNLVERHCSGPDDLEWVKLLVNDPVGALQNKSGQSVWRLLLEDPQVPPSVKDEIGKSIKLSWIESFEQLNRVVVAGIPASEQELKESSEMIARELKHLQAEGAPSVQVLEKKLAPKIESSKKYFAIKKDLEDHVAGVRLLDLSSFTNVIHYSYMLGQAFAKEKKWKEISALELTSRSKTEAKAANLFVHQLMMEKMNIPERDEYSGFWHVGSCSFLLQGLDGMKQDPLFPILEPLIPILQESIIVEKKISFVPGKIAALTVGESLLIPTGCSGHGTSMLITKTSEDTFSLTHYNTGQGVTDWHPRWDETNKYQTHYIITDIPKESILNDATWSFYVPEALSGLNIDSLYEVINQRLGKGGKLLPPSPYEEDYEAKQVSGSCSVQNLMAFLRHSIMSAAQGTPAQKEAVYKAIKAKMLSSFSGVVKKQLNETIQKAITPQLAKLEADMYLLTLAQDKKTFADAMASIFKQLHRLDKTDIIEELNKRPSNSNWDRYATLRMASSLLAIGWIDQPLVNPKADAESPALQYALAKYDYRTLVMERIQLELAKLTKEDDIDKAFYEIARVIGATSYASVGFQEVVKIVGQESPSDCQRSQKFIQTVIKLFDKKAIPLILNFARELEKLPNQPLADWVKSQANERTSSVTESAEKFD